MLAHSPIAIACSFAPNNISWMLFYAFLCVGHHNSLSGCVYNMYEIWNDDDDKHIIMQSIEKRQPHI